MEITKVQALTKQKYRIFLDGESAFAVYKGELSRYHLEEGAVLPPEVYEELVNRKDSFRHLFLQEPLLHKE